ncbi:Tyrosyl-DNA phosphodiesterase 1 [Morella rubra]|uniref:Tyrosyl-DNA phosphodiesterase 1 n=1 Tax=Morella rubra TaxID=262757 RepID=A0A6A1UN61_9ROSI|nr:Tyrosyl-DNA phosphodiesterase 1 [Morella rubra]
MSFCFSQIGYLVPLSKNLEEDTSIPKITLSEGQNVISRDNIPLPDKRLSRKHLTLTASADRSSANLFVEGTNPVVVTFGNKRTKVCSQESTTISDGAIIELIPGHHFFKYVTSGGDENASSRSTPESSDGREVGKGDEPSAKRSRQTKMQDGLGKKTLGEGSSVEVGNPGRSQTKGEISEKAIGHFHVLNDMLPWTFRLLQVKELPAWSNTSCVSIRDVIQGDILLAVLSNYMVDLDWLLPDRQKPVDKLVKNKPANWILHKPPLPISFGTHHSKAMLLVYPRGVRIIVHTANLIYVDWNNKSQGLWMQDFPWKDPNFPSKACGFENDLIDYLCALKWPEFSVILPGLGNFKVNPTFFRKFDYSNAAVRLIASVPGYHMGTNLKKWGHMKLRTVLQECTFDKEFKSSPLAYQFSSLGSLDEKWLAELASSMSAGFTEDKTALGLGEPCIIWPTVEDVRCSLEGYAAGNAIPSPLKNVEKGFLKKYWAKWKASHTGRCWLLLTSSNLSKAAWGALQKNNSQLMIRSYELGVLFLPTSVGRCGSGFSCTSNRDLMEMSPGLGSGDIARKMFMVKFGHDKYSCILSKLPDIILFE